MVRPRLWARARSQWLARSAKANSTVAKPSSSGTRISNSRPGVASSSSAPQAAPIIEARHIATKSRLKRGNCLRSDSAARNEPGKEAVRLQVVAGSGGMPAAISAG